MTILSITACTSNGYTNLYGLADDNRVYRWNPVEAEWEPYKIKPKPRSEARRGETRRGDSSDWDRG